MILNVTELSADPIHDQICRQLLERILIGRCGGGDELSRPRSLARRLGVNAQSVVRAYEALEAYGAVVHSADGRWTVARLGETDCGAIRRRALGDSGALLVEIQEEMRTAQQIQAALFPRALPDDSYLTVAARSQPSQSVGGDFYDVIALDNRRLGLVIADASGKGLPAALMIAQAHALMRSETRHTENITAVVANVNNQIAQFTGAEKFVTLFYGVFDPMTGVLDYVNAGHNHPILIRENGEHEVLAAGGPMLGIVGDGVYERGGVTLGSGDFVFAYTDGVTEAVDRHGEPFGENRLVECLRRRRYQSPEIIVDSVMDDVTGFEGSDGPGDDRTVLLLRVNDVKLRLF